MHVMFSQTVKMAAELRKPIYKAVAVHAIDYEFVLQQMSNVRWDVKEIMSQHNNYVDHLLAVRYTHIAGGTWSTGIMTTNFCIILSPGDLLHLNS